MKTPREIILDQHRNAEAKLAQIRPEDLAAVARQEVGKIARAETPSRGPFSRIQNGISTAARNFWQQSLLPWRRAWLGMAGVWVAIIALHFVTNTTRETLIARAPKTEPPIVLAQLREQRQLMAQLLGVPAVPANPPAKTPGPRSSLRIELLVV